jgi:nitroreductase
MGREPWKFVVIEDKKLIKYISEETKLLLQQMMPSTTSHFQTEEDIICYNAPVLILVCTEKDKEEHFNDLNLLDSVLAAQNMFLKAYEPGLGTCYMGFVMLLRTKPDALKKVGVPDGCELMVPFIMGHPKTKQGSGNRSKPNVLKWIR